jgi:hypothetical protein
LSGDLLKKAFEATHQSAQASKFQLSTDAPPLLVDTYDDLSFIQAHFTFETKAATNFGIVNLIQVEGRFVAWTVFTLLGELKAFPQKERPMGTDRRFSSWNEQHATKLEQALKEPTVLCAFDFGATYL